MKKSVIIALAIISIIALAGLGAWSMLNSSKPYAGKPEHITVGMPVMLDASAILYIADERHFFADNGLDVTLKTYDSGLLAVNDMLDNNSDIAVATEFIVISKALQQEKVTGLGSIAKYQTHDLIGRSDHGIKNVSDLKGKKIGFARATSGEFYLNRFLELHGIKISDVVPVDVEPSHYASAIENGSVDAILAWNPQASIIEEQLGSNAVAWPAQSGQLGSWVAISQEEWVAKHPELIERFLKSVDEAAQYNVYHPDEARAIVKKRTGADDAYINKTWSNTQFSISLDQSLITIMEDEARWMINNNLTGERKVPYLKDYIYLDAMKAVKPESVNVILVNKEP